MDIRDAINIRLTSIKILKILVMKPLFLYSLQKEWFNETTNIIMKKIIGKNFDLWLDGGHNIHASEILFTEIDKWKKSKIRNAGSYYFLT